MSRTRTWTKERVLQALRIYVDTHGRYPSAHEIDDHPHFPSSKHIQRQFGGLVALRKELGILPHNDLTKSTPNQERLGATKHRYDEAHGRLGAILATALAKGTAEADTTLTDDHRTKMEFRVMHATGVTLVTMVAPKDSRTLIGCLRSKERTCTQIGLSGNHIIIVAANTSREELSTIMKRRTRKLAKHIRIMSEEEIAEWIRK
jgi:hypothetical protein